MDRLAEKIGATTQAAPHHDEATKEQERQQKAEAAAKFAKQFKAAIEAAATSASGPETALEKLCASKEIQDKLTGLKRFYPDLYKQVIESFLQDHVISKVGRLQTSAPQLYDDIMGESANKQGS
jgi:hypothetical protein